eukprot:2512347-Pleurochrysis_carterae.AAC.1
MASERVQAIFLLCCFTLLLCSFTFYSAAAAAALFTLSAVYCSGPGHAPPATARSAFFASRILIRRRLRLLEAAERSISEGVSVAK